MLATIISQLSSLHVSRLLPAHQRAAAVASASRTSAPVASATDMQTRFRSNRSRRGLYDGKDIRSGNNVSFSMKATKRTFKPNVFKKRVYSDILDAMIPFHLTASTLRSIDKAGGLDNYLLKNKKITEGEGYEIRRKIEKRLKNNEKREKKAATLEAS